MNDSRKTPINEVLPTTPGAQTRDAALASVERRRAELFAKIGKSQRPDASNDADIAASEPVPHLHLPDPPRPIKPRRGKAPKPAGTVAAAKTMSNRERIARVLELIGGAPAGKIEALLVATFATTWRKRAKLPPSLAPADDMDAHAWLYVLIYNWDEAFRNTLKSEMRDAARAVLGARAKYAHSSAEIEDGITLRAISAAADLLRALGATAEAAETRTMFNDMIATLAPGVEARPGPFPPFTVIDGDKSDDETR